jgi:hypothetical protein
MTDTFQPDVTQELAGLWHEMHGLKDMVETLLLRDQKTAAQDDADRPDEGQPEKGSRRVAVYFDYDKDMNKIPSDAGEYGIVLTFDAEGRLTKSEHVRRTDRTAAKKSVADGEGWAEPEDDVEGFKDDGGDDAEGWDAAEDDTDGDDEDDEDDDEFTEDVV